MFNNVTLLLSAARTLKFGRQAGADDDYDDYDDGASGYDSYWKNLAAGGRDQQDNYDDEDEDAEDDEEEEDDDEEEEEEDDEEEEEEEGKEEKAADTMAGLKLDGSAWAQTETGAGWQVEESRIDPNDPLQVLSCYK